MRRGEKNDWGWGNATYKREIGEGMSLCRRKGKNAWKSANPNFKKKGTVPSLSYKGKLGRTDVRGVKRHKS